MNTNQLKRFAIEARNKLKAGIAAKISTLGFDAKGMVSDAMRPELMEGGAVWNGSLQTEAFYHQWMSLYERVQQKGISHVYEEAAYTWFNRLVAIRILQKNGLADPVMKYADSARTPRIVDEARQGVFPQMTEQMRSRLVDLLDDDTKVTEQFALLISAWCHQNPIISACFGGIADYTELLLPANILAEGQFVDMLNHTEFITDYDFRSPELIGWLYQFYISERKDEVFAKKGKYDADEIPAATQIFTPNWIVKYMVQNTIGRIYLDNNPGETVLAEKWQYLVTPSEPTPKEAILHYGELEQLKVADLACGSGHILGEAFDLLYDLYIGEGYARREAIEHIFRNNLTGIDLDTRAKQLAMFALLLKACQRDSSFADAKLLPRVMDMPKPFSPKEGLLTDWLHQFFRGEDDSLVGDEIQAAFDLMQNADSLGSIMKFDISDSTRLLIAQMVGYWEDETVLPKPVERLLPTFRLILALTEKYDALVMNPPYMGSGRMGAALSKYVKTHYEEGKADLFSVFMLLATYRLKANGKYGMINMQNWMFLSSFESLRKTLLTTQHFDSMLHLGPRAFDELSGDVVQNTAFVVTNAEPTTFKSSEPRVVNEDDPYSMITEPTIGGVYYWLVNGKNCEDKRQMFLAHTFVFTDVKQTDFEKIPGEVIAYWPSTNVLNLFAENKESVFGDYIIPRHGLATSDNNRFLKLWYEINFYSGSLITRCDFSKKWYPMNKGGKFRKWYGNLDWVINYENDGEEIKAFAISLYKNSSRTIQNTQFYFKESLTWSALSSGPLAVRWSDRGAVFGSGAHSAFTEDKHLMLYSLGLMNGKLMNFFLGILSPTLNTNVDDIRATPLVIKNGTSIAKIVQQNITLSKLDWDAHETSWEFQRSPLLDRKRDCGQNVADLDMLSEEERKEIMEEFDVPVDTHQISHLVKAYKHHWERQFNQLHGNEEELNRQFISIYGLEDELTPDVPLSEVTILQQGEISIDNNQICWHDDVIIKQFISYIVGCYMGRYRLDRPGLAIAYPDAKPEETAPYTYKDSPFAIDDDGIIPLMAADCGFSDNGAARVAEFVGMVLGTERQTENLNYMEQCLGKTIEAYMIKDFWKDHKKMYQNHPIYWLFASKKGTFQCIAYMHRMNAYTAERVRAKYLLPFIEHLQNRINDLNGRAASLSTKENKQLTTLQKQLEECQEYHDRLQVIAEQALSFDLDDGVVVNYAKFGDVLAKIK